MSKYENEFHNFFINIGGVVSISKEMLSHVLDVNEKFIDAALEVLENEIELNETQLVEVITLVKQNGVEHSEYVQKRFTLELVSLLLSVLSENNFEVDKTAVKFLQKNYGKALLNKEGK